MKRILAGGLLALASSTLVHQRAQEGGPVSRPGGDEGMLLYTVGRLTFEAPAGWEARGDPRHVLLVSPQNDARIDAQLSARTYRDDAECLSQAEQSLASGAAQRLRGSRERAHATARPALRRSP